jgi:hypothetical protein
MISLATMIVLTQPLDVREGRWWKITISLPLIWVVVAQLSAGLGLMGGIASILSIVLLGFIWSGTTSFHLSDSPVHLLHGQANIGAGHIADFKYARAKIKDRDFQEAVKLTLHELEKNPENFEGLILLAQLYFEMRHPAEALKQVESILHNPDATPEQIERATVAKIECLNELNRGDIKPK